MQRGIAQLEELFSTGRSDPKILGQLEHELRHRQVPRAVSLLVKVRAAMRGSLPPGPASLTTGAPQGKLVLGDGSPVTPPKPDAGLVRSSAGTKNAPSSPSATKAPRPKLPQMPLEDAYKLLKATATTSWEVIEQTRRELVERSSPSLMSDKGAEQREKSIEEAGRVNDAYDALSQARCGNR